ncbi:MAG: site-2 protease family protein [Anaerolineae bacterium]
MKWSFQLASIKGIKINIHLTFFLIIIWGAFSYGQGQGAGRLAFGAALTVMVFGIVLLHELGHSLVALGFGISVRDITLLPIGGVARLERMPQKPLQEFAVAIAGPGVNVLLAALSFPLLWWASDGHFLRLFFLGLLQPNLMGALQFLFVVNLSLLVFNMIPAFPLDGGRVFRSILAAWLGFGRATRIAVWVGQGLAFLMGVYGLYRGNWVLAFIALFIFAAGGAEGRSVAVKTVLSRISVRQALSRVNTTLHPGFTVLEVATMTLHLPQSNFPVMLGDALVGVIGRRDIRGALEKGKKLAPIAEVMRRDFPNLGIDVSLSEAQDKLFQANAKVAAVYEGPIFRGLLGFEDIERAFQLSPSKKTLSQPA